MNFKNIITPPLVAMTLLASSFSHASSMKNDVIPNMPQQQQQQQQQQQSAFFATLTHFKDLAVKFTGNGNHGLTPNRSVLFFYDNDCKFCNKMLNEIPKLNDLGIDVYLFPYLNHGFYTDAAKQIYLAWSTQHPISALLNHQYPKNLI